MDAEHRQGSKILNDPDQQRKRKEKRRKHLAKSFKDAEVERNTILDILRKNKSVEEELALTQESNLFADATVAAFLELKPASKLEDFIHARKCTLKSFSKRKLIVRDKSSMRHCHGNRRHNQSKKDYGEENPCLVWFAASLQSYELVLKAPRAHISVHSSIS